MLWEGHSYSSQAGVGKARKGPWILRREGPVWAGRAAGSPAPAVEGLARFEVYGREVRKDQERHRMRAARCSE